MTTFVNNLGIEVNDEGQVACACGKPGGYRIGNSREDSGEEDGVREIRRAPPWFRDETNVITNRPTGRRELCYPGGSFCHECAVAEFQRRNAGLAHSI